MKNQISKHFPNKQHQVSSSLKTTWGFFLVVLEFVHSLSFNQILLKL